MKEVSVIFLLSIVKLKAQSDPGATVSSIYPPSTISPIYPEATVSSLYPVTVSPIYPEATVSPIYPPTISPIYPETTVSPLYPDTVSPIYPPTISPLYPVTVSPIYPETTVSPLYPPTVSPIFPYTVESTVSPIYPPTLSPIYPADTTVSPMYPAFEGTTVSPIYPPAIDTTVIPTTTVPETTTPNDPFWDFRCTPACTLEFDSLTLSSMKYFPVLCETVCTRTTLRIGIECDMTEKQMNDTLKNMKHLVGGLLVSRSKFKSAQFLANLESIDCGGHWKCANVREMHMVAFPVHQLKITGNLWDFKVNLNDRMTEIGMPNLKNVSCRVFILNNNNMTRLNLPKLIPIHSPLAPNYTLEVEVSYNLHPEFCISLQEMSNFMTYDYIRFSLLTGSFCPQSHTSSEAKTCDLVNYTWSEMSTDCVNVHGDVIIHEENEDHADKLASVVNIFGSLIIIRTNLTSIDFLDNLEHIISLTDEQPALIVEQNEMLANVSFPKLERVTSRAYVPVRFDNNSLELIKSPSFCYDIRNGITKSDTWIVKFDDKVCEDVEKAAAASVVKDKSSRTTGGRQILMILAAVGFIFGF
ncbi:Protein CBG06481 [Caenorhabditis briggsae]|uniref:Protein CBG06481 n=1 Tax=Caenorhabditis briggsae TaxID=6238 RepID=A8X2B7_CAEBR|nr:Protein CBG06481 [Caenorhabditis briggsae]CAP26777.2 Protein CBG06481 [Caenorhabditis briggsae]